MARLTRLAILDRHGAVRPLGHDLHRAAVGRRDPHPHEVEAERAITGSTIAATRAATPVSVMRRLSRWLAIVRSGAPASDNKKERTRRGPLSNCSVNCDQS